MQGPFLAPNSGGTSDVDGSTIVMSETSGSVGQGTRALIGELFENHGPTKAPSAHPNATTPAKPDAESDRNDRPKFWSASQCLTWNCTREDEMVAAISRPFDATSFRLAFLSYRNGFELRPRLKGDGSIRVWKTIGQAGFMPSDEAFKDLMKRAGAGKVRLKAQKPGQSGFAEVDPEEIDDLEFHIEEDVGGAVIALWSYSKHLRCWVNPMFSRQDVKRNWPAPSARALKLQTAVPAILALLVDLTKSGPITKDDAFERTKTVSGWYARAFESAWRRLPADRKFARGKHGARRH